MARTKIKRRTYNLGNPQQTENAFRETERASIEEPAQDAATKLSDVTETEEDLPNVFLSSQNVKGQGAFRSKAEDVADSVNTCTTSPKPQNGLDMSAKRQEYALDMSLKLQEKGIDECLKLQEYCLDISPKLQENDLDISRRLQENYLDINDDSIQSSSQNVKGQGAFRSKAEDVADSVNTCTTSPKPQNGLDMSVKPHPNGLDLSSEPQENGFEKSPKRQEYALDMSLKLQAKGLDECLKLQEYGLDISPKLQENYLDINDDSIESASSVLGRSQGNISIGQDQPSSLATDTHISRDSPLNLAWDSSMKKNCQPQANAHNFRPVTPDITQIPVDEIFSPTIQKEFRSTVLALFPNGPPPPPPVRPMRRPNKGDTPYIVGCKKRARVPSPKSLTVFQGDDYGITDSTNCQEDEEQCPSAKRGRRGPKGSGNLSKSRFNPQSNEIAERLKLYEKIDRLVGRTPREEPVNYTFKPRSFSPLPSTSTDNETIMKNDKHFSESLNSDHFDIDDDEDLPEVLLDTSYYKKEKDRKASPLPLDKDKADKNDDKKGYTDNVVIEIHEDMNNNNNDIIDDDFCEIQFDKYMPKEQLLYYSDEEDVKSKRAPEVIDLKDGFHSAPSRVICPTTSTDVICVEDVLNTNNSPNTNRNVNPVSTANTSTSVLRASNKHAPSIETKQSDLVIEVPDALEPINMTCQASTSRPHIWNEDVQFVSEVRANDRLRRNVSDVQMISQGTSSSESTIRVPPDFNTMTMLLLLDLSESIERRKPRSQPRKKPKRQKSKENPGILVVNNENTAPSVNQALVNNSTSQPAATTSPEAKKLGECPICLENLSRGSIASTNCGHVFCLECIEKSLKASGKKCPTCRKQLRGVGYHLVFL